jgi:hypothetical protein
MGKVDCFQVPGVELYFNSSDHMPPHFHAHRTDEWEIRVYFLTSTESWLNYDVKWPQGGKPPAPVLKDLLSNVLTHREDLLREWERKVCPQ